MMVSCSMMIIANIIEYVGIISGAIFSKNIEFNAILIYLPINGMNVLVYAYFYQICAMWASMYTGKLVISGPGPSGRGGASLGAMGNNKENIPAAIDDNDTYKNKKKKAKTLAELAKEHEELQKNKPSDLA